MRALVIVLAAACSSAPVPPPSPIAAPRPALPSESSGIPAGYVDAKVMQVVALPEGNGAVLLLDETGAIVLPIFIGGTEAVSIDARMRNIPRPRPLTHDLYDATIRKLGGKLVKVQVDKLEDEIYHGSVFIRVDGRIIKLDARPSDALALAIGNKVPIYVAKKVFEQAGVDKNEILKQLAPPPGSEA
jgi:bifunctional DNase/RNase